MPQQNDPPEGNRDETPIEAQARRKAQKTIEQREREKQKEQQRTRHRRKQAGYRAAKKIGGTGRPQNVLKMTWLAGLLAMWIYPLSTPEWARQYNGWLMRQILWTVIHIVLLMASAAGPRIARVSAAFGGLAVLGLLLAPTEDRGSTYGRMIADTVRRRVARQPAEGRPDSSMSEWLRHLTEPAPPPDADIPPVPLPPQAPQVPDGDTPGIGIPV